MDVVELFAGAGGLSLGAVAEELNVTGAFDHWQPAIDTYSANFNHSAQDLNLGDVESCLPIVGAYQPDVILGGPPCQDFSDAGNRSEGSRAELTVAFAQYVEVIKPRAFVMENVPAALRSAAYAKAKAKFLGAKYGITELVLNAAYFGVPQARKRLFVVGILNDVDDGIRGQVDRAQSLLPMTVDRGAPGIDLEHYYRHPRSYDRRAVFSVTEPSPTIRGTNRPRPRTYRPHENDSYKGDDVRALTYSERAEIQTFPDDYRWEGAVSEIEQMVGNAVPPRLAQVVIAAIKDRIWGVDRTDVLPIATLSKKGVTSSRMQSLLLTGRRLHRSTPMSAGENIAAYWDRLRHADQFKQLSGPSRRDVETLFLTYIESVVDSR